MAKLEKVLKVMATSKNFPLAQTQWPFHEAIVGFTESWFAWAIFCRQRKDNREIVGGAERYPGPHGNAPHGVGSSIIADDDLEKLEYPILEIIVCMATNICFQAGDHTIVA